MVDDYYEHIVQFLAIGTTSKEMTTSQNKKLVVKVADFLLIVGQLYKLGPDDICDDVSYFMNKGRFWQRNMQELLVDTMEDELLRGRCFMQRLWWPTLHEDMLDYAWTCDVCQ